MKVVVINGSAGVGKDTFCDLSKKYCKSKSYSSVDKVKEIAVKCGWNGVKDDKSRKFLSDLKRLTTEFNDMSMECMRKKVKLYSNSGTQVLFLHIREPEEIDRAREEFEAITLLIENSNVEHLTSNDSDRRVFDLEYDYIIDNSGTINDLESKVENFIKEILS